MFRPFVLKILYSKDKQIVLSFRLNLQIAETLGSFLKTMFEGIQCMFSFLGFISVFIDYAGF